MATHDTTAPEQRRFLAINFRVGTCENGYLIGPALVSTSDYARLHFWDEPYAAEFDAEDYQIVKLYPRGLTYDQAARQFAKDFPLAISGPLPPGWVALGTTFGTGALLHPAGRHAVAA
jgi:hypothetical protein